jgi:hypothetical protein
MFDYMTKLMLSAAPGLLAAGCVDQALIEEMTRELATLRQAPNSVYYYSFIQASAVAD